MIIIINILEEYYKKIEKAHIFGKELLADKKKKKASKEKK